MIFPIVSFIAAGILVGVSTFAYLGGYWYQLWKGDDEHKEDR